MYGHNLYNNILYTEGINNLKHVHLIDICMYIYVRQLFWHYEDFFHSLYIYIDSKCLFYQKYITFPCG